MQDASDIPWDLIADTLAGEQGDVNGERPQAERDALERWLAEQPAHRHLFTMAQRVWETDSSLTGPDVAMLKAQVSARIGVDIDQYKKRIDRSERVLPLALRGRQSKAQPLRRGAWYIASSLVVGILGFVMVRYGQARHSFVPMSTAVSTYATTSGERANITLPDGSKVTLDVASRLDVPVDYATGDHTVYLSGEALFTVMRHDRRPFTVIAGSTTARVLGTSFAVRHYPTDTTAIVAVREGKVAVGDLVVTASRLVEVGPRQIVRRGSANAAQFGFATGVLTLPSMPLAQAVVELDRWYAADIRFGDSSLARVPVGGKFTAGSLSDLANVLELMLNARAVRDDRVLTLYPRTR